jgi:AbrB family looped-hinge helix DNA binding protein
MSESTVTSKGQITIPKAVRERLHLEVGGMNPASLTEE